MRNRKAYYDSDPERWRAGSREWYKNNKDRRLAYLEKNKELMREKRRLRRASWSKEEKYARYRKNYPNMRRRYLEKKERIEEQRTISRKRNPEKYRATMRAYEEKNKDWIKAWRKEYRKTYQKTERFKILMAMSRHRRRALGNINSTEWIAKLTMLKGECQICFRKEPEVKITIDHIIPITKGGTNHIDNLQPLCHGCNSSKSNKILSENDIKERRQKALNKV